MMRPIAIIPALGIGDALILSIASHHLQQIGFEPTIFSHSFHHFGAWLEPGHYLPYPSSIPFDCLLVQHDNTARAKQLVSLREQGKKVYVFYTNYRLSKHGPLLEGYDFPFDETKTMVENTCNALKALFAITPTKQGALRPPDGLIHRKEKKRVLLHPTSTVETKNWLPNRFLKLARRLELQGFSPLFLLSPEERSRWPHVPIAPTATLQDLATLIYESGYLIGNDSGPAHLASYLSIPHLVIGKCRRQMLQWRPGWKEGWLLCPPRWLRRMKSLREEKWKYFISTRSALKLFNCMSGCE